MTKNAHLELMASDKSEVNTWRSLSKFVVPRYTFDAGARRLFINFVTVSPESGIREADVTFSEDGRRVIADFYVEGHDFDEALDTTATAALGGLVCAGLKASQVDIINIHLAWAREMQSSYQNAIDKPQYEVPEIDAFMAVASAKLHSEAA